MRNLEKIGETTEFCNHGILILIQNLEFLKSYFKLMILGNFKVIGRSCQFRDFCFQTNFPMLYLNISMLCCIS